MLDLLTAPGGQVAGAVRGASRGEGRYRLLETVRQYARERLLEAGEAAAVRDRHLDWFLALAEEAEPELRGASQSAWLERLERSTTTCGRRWSGPERRNGTPRQGCGWRARSPGSGHARLLRGTRAGWRICWSTGPAGATGRGQGRSTARGCWQSTRATSRRADPVRRECRALARAGGSAGAGPRMGWLGGCSEYSRRIPLLEESVALAREVGDPWVLGLALWHLAINVNRFQSDPERVRKLAEESVALLREVGTLWSLSRPLGNLAFIARQQGDHAAAVASYRGEPGSLRAWRQMGHRQDPRLAWELWPTNRGTTGQRGRSWRRAWRSAGS